MATKNEVAQNVGETNGYHNVTNGNVENGESSAPQAKSYPFFVPSTVKSTLGSPTALGIGAFATTLTALSFSLMNWRGVSLSNALVGDFFFTTGIGMIISAQWELVLGNSFGYTVLSAFGFFYASFGAIITPSFGVASSFGTNLAEYQNGVGFFMIMWAVFDFFFLLAALPVNVVYICIFATVDLAFTLVAASYFAAADGHASASTALCKAGGAFAFIGGMLGYYTLGNLMLQEAMFFSFPMGDTSRFFKKKSERKGQ